MNICDNPDELLSALYDGESVPAEFAQHVDTCPNCRARLRDYSHIGAELRLMASLAASAPIPQIRPRRSKFFRLAGKTSIPKFALAAAAALFIVMTVGLVQLHARQSNPLWFQFTLTEKSSTAPGFPRVAQAGYDQKTAAGYAPDTFVGTRVVVSAVESDHVQLAIRSRLYQKANANDLPLSADLKDIGSRVFTYYPGQSLEIPVEGGGTLVLKGTILDHKPRFMENGIPLDPGPNEIILGSPVLISDDKVLTNEKGANTIQDGPDRAAVLYVPGVGLLKFALRSFPGAIEGKANWGRLEFKLGNQAYTLLTASPICGGDQPRTVWISSNPNFTSDSGGFVSGDKLSDPSWK
jgi:hypothetical protein